MKLTKILYLSILSVLTPIISAYADCPETPNGTHVWLGLDTSIPTLAVWPDRPDIRELDLLRVQLVWVPADPERRYVDQHIIDIDWVKQTHTNVDVWDGELQAITIRDLHPVRLGVESNFETGQIHIESCPIYNSAGPLLLFAYYGFDGKILETLVSNGSVTNQKVSNVISNSFNNGLAFNMTEDVARATGAIPGHYLAQSFLFQNLAPSVAFLGEYPTAFFDAENAIVMQSRVYVTDNEASASLPLSIAGVFSDGVNVMDGDNRVRNLEQYLGTVQFQSRNGDNPSRYNLVIEARPELKIETTPCVDGASTLKADFVYPSALRGDIRLWLGDSGAAMTKKSSLNEWISCDYDYRVEGRRYFEKEYEHERVTTGEIWVAAATTGTLIKIQYEASYHGLPPRMTSPSVETVLKLWDVTNIESLYGRHEYFCDKPGGSLVDSIDEIANRRANLLTAEEKASLDPFTDEDKNLRAWQDGDGDGTICNKEERWSGDYGNITKITLSVYPPGG